MKKPEEIKKGLAEAPHIQYRTSTQNDSDGHSTRYAVAIGYVFRDEIVGCLQQLEANYQQISKALCGKGNATLDEVLQAIAQVKAELEAVKRERDAAVTMLESINTCDTCIHKVEAETPYISNDCFLYINMIKHKFRGVCPENTEVQDEN